MLRGSSGHRQATTTSALANIDKLCLRASRDLSRGLDKCYRHNQVHTQATANLSQCVEHYEPQLAALSAELQACRADRDAVEGSHAKLDEAFRQISVARTSRFENNLAKFSGTALGQIIKAVQGGQVDFMVIDACEDSALCSPLAAALQDFRKDLLQLMAHREASKQEAIQDAVAKTAEEKQKAAAQAESADKEFLGNSEHRAEDADALQQLSVTLKSQLTAETVRALSSNARVVVLDLHLAEIRAEVDKLTAQAAKLDEEQDFKVKLADEKARHLATLQDAAELKSQLQAAKKQLTDEMQAHLASRQALDDTQSQLVGTQRQLSDEQQAHAAAAQSAAVLQSDLQEGQRAASDFQSQLQLVNEGLAAQKQCLEDAHRKAASLQARLQEVQGEPAAEQQACVSAKKSLDSLQIERAAAQQSPAILQAKLAAAEEALAADKFAHDSGGTSLKADLGVAGQGMSVLISQLKALESELATGKQALAAVNQNPASFPAQLKATQLQAAETQAQEGEDWSVPSYQTPVRSAQQTLSSLCIQLEALQQRLAEKIAGETVDRTVSVSMQQAHQAGGHTAADPHMQLDCNTQCLQTGAHGKWAKEKQGEQAFAEAVAAVGHQVAGLGNQVEEAAQRRLSPQQALRSSLYESREGRPEADHASQLTAALRQAHPPAAPQEGVAWAQDVSRRQARHGTPTYPLQQDTSALLDQHDVQQEIQALQQELQETKAALHLAQDSLQKAEATIDCLRKEDEHKTQNRYPQPHSGGPTANLLPDEQICCVPSVDASEASCADILPTHLQASWQRMNGRHEELLQEIQALKANLSRAGALDQDAYMHDIQDHKNCSEVFDRYGEPVRLAESVMAMGRSHGLPPPTDPSLVRSIIRLNMPPEQLAFHVPRYGLVTTANCKQLMLLLEDRHGEAGLDNQDLGLTLLRAAQSVWVAANLIPWAQYNADLNFLGISGRPPLSPADQRRWFTVISRESLQDPAPLFNGYLAGMMAESKQGDWLNFDNQTQDKVCYACGAEWDGYVEDNGELVDVQLQVVNIHCPTCATYRVPDTGEQKAGDYALCLPCAQTQARVGRCPRTDGVDHELPVTRRTPQFFLKDAANAPPDLPKKKS
ncbi:MAG: hypothetical protein FRX49_02823 [Trebouxia sp. A1-2]|nr:MAG: hypothetical protein FRX49_02823 [Trebouxia sp. A1-2]